MNARTSGSMRALRPGLLRGWGVPGLVFGALALAGCRAAPAPARTVHAVAIRGMQFDPAVVRAAVGDTLRWTNRDLVPHTVTSRTGDFDSKDLPPDSTFSLVVSAAGSQPYACTYHPTMKGTLEVQAGGPSSRRASGS